MKQLTIAIPAFNDQDALPVLIRDIIALKSLLPEFDILVINDGSSDQTLKVAEELAEEFSEVSVLNHPENMGFGPTIGEVVQIPKTEWIAFLPGDHQFPAEIIPEFWKYHEQHDFILGHRRNRNDTLRRKINSKLYNHLVKLYAGIDFKDVNSVFLCRSALFRGVQFKSKSAFVHAEIALTAAQQRARIAVVEIPHHARKFGSGSGGKLSVIVPTIADFFRYLFHKSDNRPGK